MTMLIVIATILSFSFNLTGTGSATVFAHSRLNTYDPAQDNTAVTTYHNDNLRTGQNLSETKLTTANVNAQQFGKRVTYSVDGQVYAQPLFVPNVSIDGVSHNVVYVATENDSVYAFDADEKTNVTPLWQASFINPEAGVTPVPAGDVYQKYGNQDINPQIGITGTPVIDRNTGTLYVVTMTKENDQYVQRLHAIDISTGKDKQNPTEIEASLPGTGYNNVNGVVSFNARAHNQRSALLLSNGIVYITWAGFGDTDVFDGKLLGYHGWVMGYDVASLKQVSVYNDTLNASSNNTDSSNNDTNGSEGGIWMSGAGLAADAGGNIYATTGNGSYDLNIGGDSAGDSFIKLDGGLKLNDYFTPFNQSCLDGRDEDLGSGGSLLLPDQPGEHPHLLLGEGKEGRVYLIDRDNMGKFTENPNLQCGTDEEGRLGIDKVVQETPPQTTGSLFGTASYWAGAANSGSFVYIGGFSDALKSFQIANGLLSPTSIAQTPETFTFSGATPSISSNGDTSGTGIVWLNSSSSCGYAGCTPTGPGALRAYDATDVSHELYNSEENSGRDRVDSYVKFSVPTVANGLVFVGTNNSLNIYGLLDS